MKKIALAVTLFLSTLVHAEQINLSDWVYVTDAITGNPMRLLGKKASISLTKNKHGVWVIGAQFAYYSGEKDTTVVYTAIELSSCESGEGQLVFIDKDAPAGTEPVSVFWSARGSKMYDIEGAVMCRGIKNAQDAVPKLGV